MDSRGWTGHAAIVFGTLAYLLSLLNYIVSTYTSSLAHLRDGLSHEDFAVFSLSEGARFVGGRPSGLRSSPLRSGTSSSSASSGGPLAVGLPWPAR